jgi:hypothetical protein
MRFLSLPCGLTNDGIWGGMEQPLSHESINPWKESDGISKTFDKAAD